METMRKLHKKGWDCQMKRLKMTVMLLRLIASVIKLELLDLGCLLWAMEQIRTCAFYPSYEFDKKMPFIRKKEE